MARHCTLFAATLSAVLLSLAPPLVAASEAGFDADHRVTFRSGATPKDKLNFNAPHDTIAGYLYRPQGAGPFPAVVLEPGVPGLMPVHKAWTLRLVEWGYVVLAVDFLSHPQNKALTGVTSSHDAYGALKYLAGLPYVDAQRVVWLGWSTGGGQPMLLSGLEANPNDPERPLAWLVSEGPWRFQAGIALYPECPGIGKTYYAPVLMLLAGKDSRGLNGCKATAAQSTAGGQPVRVHVFPGATRRFDIEGVKQDFFAETAHYDAAAAQESVAQVKAFLAEDRSGGWFRSVWNRLWK